MLKIGEFHSIDFFMYLYWGSLYQTMTRGFDTKLMLCLNKELRET